MSLVLILLFVGLSGVVVWLLLRWPDESRHDYEASERARMPDELAQARLVLSERQFRSEVPVRLVCRVDQAFQRADGVVVLMESKRRKSTRVFETDVIELSGQRVVLEANGYRVAPHAYVRIVTGDRVTYQRTRLLQNGAVLEIYHAYRALLGGAVPEAPKHIGMCRGCGHAPRCEVRMAMQGRGSLGNGASKRVPLTR